MLPYVTTFAWVTAIAALLQTTAGAPTPNSPPVAQNLARQNANFAITGVQSDAPGLRLELRELQKNPTMWNLYLLAMQRFQAKEQSDELSWYQTAGIHGAPFVEWDGVEGSNQGSGYCPHNSNLFGPWHRPYLALFEQILQGHAIDIANEWSDSSKAEYVGAAAALRIPYWDWADKSNIESVPAAMKQPNIQVTFPNGTEASIANPLYSYEFHPVDAAALQFDADPVTLRNPPSTPGSISDDTALESSIHNQAASLTAQVYQLLTKYQPFNTATNHGSGSSPDGDQNLESIHDNIHSQFGQGGHMTYVTVAAHDPAFMLHHCNVDRLLAIFQAMYPDTYIEPHTQQGPTFTINAGDTEDGDSPLTPFHGSDGEYWTAQDVRNITVLGYSYPELISRPSNDTLRASINRLYGPDQGQAGVGPAAGGLGRRNDAPKRFDYFARVALPAKDTQYSVLVFIGDFKPDPAGWFVEPNLVGSHSVLASPGMAMDKTITVNIPLSAMLKQKHDEGKLGELDEDSVIGYLKKEFHWRIRKVDGTEMKRDECEGLKVTVTSVEVVPRTCEEEFPTLVGGYRDHPEVSGQ